MQRLIILLLVGALAWYGYGKYQARRTTVSDSQANSQPVSPRVVPGANSRTPPASQFKCDVRTSCSQMTSCEEATFFLKNCPGTKMDGNNDGIPCEKQWCK